MIIMIKLIIHDECLLNARYLASLTDFYFHRSVAPTLAWGERSAKQGPQHP